MRHNKRLAQIEGRAKDNKETVASLKKKVQKFCEVRDWDQFHNAKDLALGFIVEAAELLELFRWKSEAEVEKMFANENKRALIVDETADIFYFILRLAQKYHIDLADALEQKLEKNNKKYPIHKAKGSSKKYTEY